MNTTIHWLTTAFDNIVAFLPNLIAGLIILLVGWLIASVLARATRAIAHRLGFDRLIAKLGYAPSTTERPHPASYRLGSIVYLIVMVVTVMQASRAFRLDFIANGLAAIIAYLPNVLAAALVFGAALYVGNWVRARFYRTRPAEQAAEAVALPTTSMMGPQMLPEIVRGVIIAIGVFMALRELKIADDIVNAAFILTLGAIAVAVAIAFGVGGREVAGRIAQSWWERRSTIPPLPTPSSTPGRIEVRA